MKNAKLTRALIAIDVLLALALAVLWLAPGPFAHWRNWQAPAPQAPNLDDARAAQLAPNPALRRDYPAIAERPLFSADRKPRAAGAAQASVSSDSLDQAKLYGLIDGPAAQGVLLEQNGQSQFVRRGEKIGDWTLQAIQERNAVFVNKGGQRRTMPLPDSLTDPARAAEAVPAPPARFQPVPAPGYVPQPMRLPARPGGQRTSRQVPSQLAASPFAGWFLNLAGLNRIEAQA